MKNHRRPSGNTVMITEYLYLKFSDSFLGRFGGQLRIRMGAEASVRQIGNICRPQVALYSIIISVNTKPQFLK